MATESFLRDLAQALGTSPSQLTPDFPLVWESLLTLGVMAAIDQHFDLTLDVVALGKCASVGELLRLIETESAARKAA